MMNIFFKKFITGIDVFGKFLHSEYLREDIPLRLSKKTYEIVINVPKI